MQSLVAAAVIDDFDVAIAGKSHFPRAKSIVIDVSLVQRVGRKIVVQQRRVSVICHTRRCLARWAFIMPCVVFIGRLHADFVSGIVFTERIGAAVGFVDGLPVAQPLELHVSSVEFIGVGHGGGEFAADFRVSADGDGAFFIGSRRRGWDVAVCQRGVTEGIDGNFLGCRSFPAAIGPQVQRPQVEVDLLFRRVRNFLCAFRFVQDFAGFCIAQGPGDFVRLPVKLHGRLFEGCRPDVIGHVDAAVHLVVRRGVVGKGTFEGFLSPARDFHAVNFTPATYRWFCPFKGKEAAEDGVFVEFAEVALEGGLVGTVAHGVAGNNFRTNRGFTIGIGE